jgi:hypothetical protein
MTISGILIITVINVLFWYLLFFKTRKLTRELVRKGAYNNTYTDWVVSEERYRFPMWMFIIFTISLLCPILELIMLLIFYIGFIVFFTSGFFEDFTCYETEKPKLFIQDFLTKKV